MRDAGGREERGRVGLAAAGDGDLGAAAPGEGHEGPAGEVRRHEEARGLHGDGGDGARLIRASELNGEMDDEDDDSGGEWRLKYERAIRESEFVKKRLQQECDDKVEAEQQSKRQLERRLTDLQADSEEVQRSVQQLKKKCQRLTAELQDTKLHLESQQTRNHDLEKKQRKFDSELAQARTGRRGEDPAGEAVPEGHDDRGAVQPCGSWR
ncbi:hypothetical protein ANANG_G00151470 [Anguilla anguilla]|uniref:Myosin tail domain-containing protein n=1 Tax=Anguilla anguilla TaxID=7936 RepID=A0A9D3M7Z2_ANGAN|nr:hypothetical protein ANANG_G00151470 [Anguilla anguilla]